MNPTSSRHYLDHASSSPMRPEAVEAMVEWMGPIGAADPGRVHSEGRQARAAIEQARGQVADLVGVRPRQVIFTSGATEAANAAVWGATRARPGGVVVCPTVEHSSVRDASRRLAPVLDVTVDALGRVDPDCFIEALEG
ncbi:MAG: aminotransferase class V-fold PLP-dependent enzyme, partial [Acidimicrobiales bacterium]